VGDGATVQIHGSAAPIAPYRDPVMNCDCAAAAQIIHAPGSSCCLANPELTVCVDRATRLFEGANAASISTITNNQRSRDQHAVGQIQFTGGVIADPVVIRTVESSAGAGLNDPGRDSGVIANDKSPVNVLVDRSAGEVEQSSATTANLKPVMRVQHATAHVESAGASIGNMQLSVGVIRAAAHVESAASCAIAANCEPGISIQPEAACRQVIGAHGSGILANREIRVGHDRAVGLV
jgi:hypothetical protein